MKPALYIDLKLSVMIASLLVLFVFKAGSQTIKFDHSLEKAMELSKQTGKPIFLFIDVITPPVRSFKSGLEDADVAKRFNASFINVKLPRDSSSSKYLKNYYIRSFPAFIFLDKRGNMLYRSHGNFSSPEVFRKLADNALNKAGSGETLSSFEDRYKAGQLAAPEIKEYIKLKQELGLNNNAELIDAYVDSLPVSALNDYQTVLFILKAGPLVYGKAYKLAYTNSKIVDSIYSQEDREDRVAINNTIINNSFRKAVAEKDLKLATSIATYSQNTYRKENIMEGYKSYQTYMLSYYKAVKDTSNYLRQASRFYNNYYYRISADSAMKLDAKKREAAMKKASQNRVSAPPAGEIPTKYKQISSYSQTSVRTTSVANTLNSAAWEFYLTGTRNQEHLINAIKWSRRSIELSPVYAYYDTLAHLLYRYGFTSEAEAMQKEAVKLSASQGRPADKGRMEGELRKIQKGTL